MFFKKFFKNKVHSDGNFFSDDYAYYPEDLRRKCELDDKYEKVLDKHFKLLEKIKMNYTVVMNLGDEFSPQMDNIIQDCITDIELASIIRDYYVEYATINNEKICLPTYDSFKRLAIIYEKRKEYEKAIDVCRKAIELGFYKDGTDGQMPGRMARIYKKLNKLG